MANESSVMCVCVTCEMNRRVRDTHGAGGTLLVCRATEHTLISYVACQYNVVLVCMPCIPPVTGSAGLAIG